MRAIITRVLERTIEYLAGIQMNIEKAESIAELTQLGSGAKQLYLVRGTGERRKGRGESERENTETNRRGDSVREGGREEKKDANCRY